MDVYIADCSVGYSGRGDTVLPRAKRAIIVKDDGSVSVHGGVGVKPLNYMGPAGITRSDEMVDNEEVWVFESRRETIRITIHALHSEFHEDLGLDEPGLLRDGTEFHLQEFLSEHPEMFGSGYTLVQREYPTGAGPVDILFQHEDGHALAVEVKRVAMIGAVDQIVRYVSALEETWDGAVRGMVAALDIRPRTIVQAEKKGIDCLEVNWDKE